MPNNERVVIMKGKLNTESVSGIQLWEAFKSPSFPCNPIPFAQGIADYVRENGTDSIKGDKAKAMLLILVQQAYGQLARLDACDEWDRLNKSDM